MTRLRDAARRAGGAALALAAALVLYRVVSVRRKRRNELTFKESSALAQRLVKRIRSDLRSYDSPWWVPSGLLQTALPDMIMPEFPELPLRREEIRLPEMRKPPGAICCPEVVPEGVVSVDWLETGDAEADATAPIVLVLPGLTGSSSSGFVRRAAKILHEEGGFRVACYNPRGRGGNELVSPFLYSVGFTEDLRRVVRHVRDAHPRAERLFAVGYSLGSNYLAKYLGEEGERCVVDGAVCLACPVDCLTISHALESTAVGRNILNPALVSFVKRMAAEHRDVLSAAPHLFDFEGMEPARTMHHFDGAITARAFGFETASDYYRWSSSGLVLHRIRVPTLFVSARNDPICPGSRLMLDNFRQNPFLISCLTHEGGHSMDWPQGVALRPWSADAVCGFLQAVRAEQSAVAAEEREVAAADAAQPSACEVADASAVVTAA